MTNSPESCAAGPRLLLLDDRFALVKVLGCRLGLVKASAFLEVLEPSARLFVGGIGLVDVIVTTGPHVRWFGLFGFLGSYPRPHSHSTRPGRFLLDDVSMVSSGNATTAFPVDRLLPLVAFSRSCMSKNDTLKRLLGAVRRVCYRRSYQRPRSFLAHPPGFIVEVVHEALCKSALFLFEALLLLSFVIAAALQLRKSEMHRPAVVFHQLRTGTSVVGDAILVDDYLVVLPKEPGVHGVGFRYTPFATKHAKFVGVKSCL